MPDSEHEEEDDGEETGEEEEAIPIFAVPRSVGERFVQALMAGGAPTEEQVAQREMQGGADNLRLRRLVESLTDDQAETLLWLVEGMSSEGRDNYSTMIFRGVLLADLWRRRPLDGGLAGG